MVPSRHNNGRHCCPFNNKALGESREREGEAGKWQAARTFSAFLRQRLLSIIGRVFDPVNETHAARDSRYSISQTAQSIISFVLFAVCMLCGSFVSLQGGRACSFVLITARHTYSVICSVRRFHYKSCMLLRERIAFPFACATAAVAGISSNLS